MSQFPGASRKVHLDRPNPHGPQSWIRSAPVGALLRHTGSAADVENGEASGLSEADSLLMNDAGVLQ